jgi:hypothetical protein
MVIHEHNALLKHCSLLHSAARSQTADLVSMTQLEVTLHLAAKLHKTLSPAQGPASRTPNDFQSLMTVYHISSSPDLTAMDELN